MTLRVQSVFGHLCGLISQNADFYDCGLSQEACSKISVLAKSIFTVVLRSFLSLWSISVIPIEHLKKPGGTLGLGSLGTDEAFWAVSDNEWSTSIRISPVVLHTQSSGESCFVTWEVAKLSRKFLVVREQVPLVTIKCSQRSPKVNMCIFTNIHDFLSLHD